MTRSQGSYVQTTTTFPTGLVEESADDLHTATYIPGSRTSSVIYEDRFTDDYTNVEVVKNGMSKLGYSGAKGPGCPRLAPRLPLSTASSRSTV